MALLMRFLTLLLAIWLCSCSHFAVGDQIDVAYFEKHVRPLLVRRCISCHGEETQESDLRVDSRIFLLEGGASGEAAVVPGRSKNSLLMRYVRREVEGMEMPPDESLSEDDAPAHPSSRNFARDLPRTILPPYNQQQ